jgi:hypothetical protein
VDNATVVSEACSYGRVLVRALWWFYERGLISEQKKNGLCRKEKICMRMQRSVIRWMYKTGQVANHTSSEYFYWEWLFLGIYWERRKQQAAGREKKLRKQPPTFSGLQPSTRPTGLSRLLEFPAAWSSPQVNRCRHPQVFSVHNRRQISPSVFLVPDKKYAGNFDFEMY